MTSACFGLYTSEGNSLADRLMRTICDDVEADRLTRRQALDRAADAIEKIAAIDEGMSDPDAASALAERLSIAFAKAGFLAVDGQGLRAHADEWSRKGAPVDHETAALPSSITMLSEATRQVAAAAAPLFSRTDISVRIAEQDPLAEEVDPLSAAKADVALFAFEGDWSRNPYVGCILMGPGGWLFLDALAEQPDPGAQLRTAVLKRDGLDYDAIASELMQLATALESMNLIASLLNEPERLSLKLETGDVGPALTALWDGEPIGAARSTDLSALLQARSVSEDLLPEIFRDAQDTPLSAETFSADTSMTLAI